MPRHLTPLSIVHQTIFADLVQKCGDAAFEFPENGSFVRVKSHGKAHFYYNVLKPGAKAPSRQYVGPADDPAIAARVENFRQQKMAWRDRWEIVRSLRAAGLPAPPQLAGQVIAALAHAGLFRLRGVLVGSLAFQTYAGMLGVKFANAALMTGDIDIAQFHSVSVLVEDSLPPLKELLGRIDPTYREIPHVTDSRATTAFINARGLRLEFLTPNRGSDDLADKPIVMPALGGASAQGLRYLDFLIHHPVESLLLHQGGIAVRVPAPERYAVHKLIVATLRRDNDKAKARKDVFQAGMLVEALTQFGPSPELALALEEALGRGPHWRERLERGVGLLEDKQKAMLRMA